MLSGTLLSNSNEKLLVPLRTTANGQGPTLAAGPTLCDLPLSLYVGAKEDGLDVLRYRRFCDKISKGTSHVEPRTLPPTSAAAMYNSLRVYYHV